GHDCDVWAEWRPPSEISGGLRTDALTGIGPRTGERGCRTTGRTTRRGTGRGTVNGRVHVTVQEVIDEVKGVVREIPARVGERIVQRALVRYTETAAQRGLAVTEYVVREAKARTEVVMVSFAQGFGWGEP